MDYKKTILKEDLIVKKIITIHYFEYAKNYIFEGERHDFWELLYVDKGEVEVMTDISGYKLKQGDIIFHKPNEFHNVWANGVVAPNLIVISFECKSKAVKFFENKILKIYDAERILLAQIIMEAKEAYTSRLDNPELQKLEKRSKPMFGSEQLIKIYLELLLINLIRKGTDIKQNSRLSSSVKIKSDEDMIKKIQGFLEANINSNISFDDVCKFTALSRTNLKVLFKSRTGLSVMEYFKKQKIELGKKMIREGNHNFTQIAEILGYTSIHYFSRYFKKVTGMTPSEYASSVKVKFDS
ncbi:MAG: AraC family transcriptional regulator [Eubacterium sp.]|jgi:AraC-like DNA-binding protein/quercetin dioxygenase-like cupin family protein|nr:AraC family transcriptional regulator [Eubacterium sp.]